MDRSYYGKENQDRGAIKDILPPGVEPVSVDAKRDIASPPPT
jgi:hypothetical protein